MIDTHINICFHGIGAPQRDLEPGEDRYWIDEVAYRCFLDELVSWAHVGISFDDGNDSDLGLGLGPLIERDLTASFYVVAGRIGRHGSLGERDLRVLRDAGMTIGSHGMHHRPWTGLDDRELRIELVDARDQLSDALGERVTDAALPLGRYDRGVLSELRRLGYTSVVSSDQSPATTGAWLQPRYSITRDDTIETLRRRVRDRQRLRHQGWGLLNRIRKSIR